MHLAKPSAGYGCNDSPTAPSACVVLKFFWGGGGVRRYEAGAYRKKNGLWVRLPPGKTYQLNTDEFHEPIDVKRDSHITKCGPLTMLTVEDGTLNGAYRYSDGIFTEFEERREYVLHEKDYHGLVTVNRNSIDKQDFGPYKVITIRDGMVGHFEKEGVIDIKSPGFYKVEANIEIRDSIRIMMNQDVLAALTFRTKDGVAMALKSTIFWQVTEPALVAVFDGSFCHHSHIRVLAFI